MLKEGFNAQFTMHNAQCSMVECLVVCYFVAERSEARNLYKIFLRFIY